MVKLDRQALAAELSLLAERQLRRRRRVVEALPEPGDATRVRVDGRLLINFCSNDYLGLSAHPAVMAAVTAAMSTFGFGAGAAHLVTGHRGEHHALEEELAAFTGRQRALLFSSGYLANIGVISALAGRHDPIVADRLCHASLLDGARLAGGPLRRYAHGDVAAAERALQRAAGASSAGGQALLVTDGVFSMDGDIAPLAALAALAARQGAVLLVDDAHGLGVLGPSGRGSVGEAGLDSAAVPLLIGTLGKAFGSFGAFVAGDAELIELLMQQARSYVFTTALPPAVAAATRAALRVAREEPWRRARLAELVQRWRAAAQAAALPLSGSPTPIQPLVVGAAARAVQLSEQLMQAGFWVSPIRPPTVPPGTARLRITLSAAHRDGDVEALAQCLGELWAREARA